MTASTSAVLLDLAARCEKAGGPDRELDSDICIALDLPRARHFSRSLDAAMTLVPKGWRVGFDRNLASDILSAPDVTAQAYVDGGAPDFADYRRAEAATPALALCAASLRARAAGKAQ